MIARLHIVTKSKIKTIMPPRILLLMMREIIMRFTPTQMYIDEYTNANYDDKKDDYEVTPDTPTNGGNNETIDNDEE